ncbi:hypothetical protein BGX33_001636, partial [Mortierella sp. NVP41]
MVATMVLDVQRMMKRNVNNQKPIQCDWSNQSTNYGYLESQTFADLDAAKKAMHNNAEQCGFEARVRTSDRTSPT